MNKDADFRTDFYSLGVVFYQMVCGTLPFSGSDSVKLIYSHIAKPPTPPHLVDFRVPITISHIILKLLSKNAEDRYQSTHGILQDLLRCQEELWSSNSISDFPVAQNDLHSTFQICQKLY